MNRTEAKKIAETVTASDLKQMFINAQNGIKDWTKVSIVNKGLTKGTAFNILSKGEITDKMHIMGKTNMVREFGEWLPNYQKIKNEQPSQPNPTHQEPIFLK